jgi:tagatose-1,6-bisphosphate aldolase
MRAWAVLSAGVPFDQFQEAGRVAFDDGAAAGIIAGRFVWHEAISLEGPARQAFLGAGAKPRLETNVAVDDKRARPWR